MILTQQSFGKTHFAAAELGDKRRTDRLVQVADQMIQRPGGSIPQKLRKPADLQAFYRLMSCEKVTHGTILEPHRNVTISAAKESGQPILVLHDTTEFDYTTHESLDLGQIGCGTRRGYIVHNSLAVRADSGEPLGVLNQILHRRAKVRKGETQTQRRKRKNRESLLWVNGVKCVPAEKQFIDVCDRGADTFEFLRAEVDSGRRFVIRSCQNRCSYIGHGPVDESEEILLHDHVKTVEPIGHWQLHVTSKKELRRGRGKEKKRRVKRHQRWANMAVSATPVNAWVTRSNRRNTKPLPIWCLRVWEIDPPEGQERLDWILLTNEPIDSFEDAYRVVGWYEKRWIIEEFHKGLKTGCRIESLQFTDEQRLQPTIALLSVVALNLLRVRNASRQPDAKTRRATEVIGEDYVEVLSSWRHKEIKRDWTVHEFYMALARMGGHQNRKSDHPPGWQVLWEGWKELLPMVIGYKVGKNSRRDL